MSEFISGSAYENINSLDDLIERGAVEQEARQLLAWREGLPSVEVKPKEHQDNARTALMEALTASGHLSKIEITGTLEEINAQVLNRLLNGWDESLPEHEKRRRFAELCNELIIEKIHRSIVDGLISPDTEIVEISDYPEALAGHRLGYRDINKKGMVRTTGIIADGDGKYTRVIEQISRSNGTWISTFGFLHGCRAIGKSRASEPDIAALETPLIYSRQQYQAGCVDMMRILDRRSGLGVRYGDRGSRLLNHPSYEDLREVSLQREQAIKVYIDKLAKLEIQLDDWLAKGKLTRTEHQSIFESEIDRILTAICTLDPQYAGDTFGDQTIAIFEQAAVLAAQGRNIEAQSLLEASNHLKTPITFCGMTISVEEAKALGLNVNEFGTLIEAGKKDWPWKKGVCVVKTCPTRPRITYVGPCSVCRHCQSEFDNGRDPSKRLGLVGLLVKA